ncbi:cbb3-type cytochrome c oxidase N-terminal domain-containing protein [Candidatus Walczuchella monophlebidarum]|uniref:cbb3-type cytochrome c oxidase N-terminal domain-containing protein n=1 Tax=Candidatus Walczuchella monophlebidarum TaxID=1415657 RepID=UPI002934E627|nr:cbb3-type cytochrome c oxidase N-terminal domain-containing protein [Candidatus Walczuchella monophlebidarum]
MSTIIISIILLVILEEINKLISNKKISFLPKEERKRLIEKNQFNFWGRIYRSGFLESKDDGPVIDHGFDEILELDNNIPSWWVQLFYITIIYAAIYFLAYIFTDFSHPEKEYDFFYKKQLSEIQSYEKKRPQATLETSLFDENLIEEGKNLFKENCATCHEADGTGNIGPNLTDDYWINKEEKSLYKNIFHIIWYGSKNNPTMRDFGASGEIKGNDIQKIASYVYFINKNRNKSTIGKSPQGKKVIWEED